MSMLMSPRLGPTSRITSFVYEFPEGTDGQGMRVQQIQLLSRALTDATPTTIRNDVTEGSLVMLAGLSLQLAGLLEEWGLDYESRERAVRALRDTHSYLLQKRQQLVDGGEVESMAELSMTGLYDYFGYDWDALFRSVV